VVVEKLRTRNLARSPLDIDGEITQPKALTHDGRRAPKAAFHQYLPDPERTASAQPISMRFCPTLSQEQTRSLSITS
jgi:hypothetical protein